MTTPIKTSRLAVLNRRLFTDNRGLSTVEYVIVLVLIAAVAMAAWKKFGTDVKTKLRDANTEFNEQVQVNK